MRRRSRGQALAEFALVLPVLLLVLIGLVDLGRGVFAYNSVTNAAREAARLAIVNQDATLVQQRGVQQVAIAETNAPNVTVGYYKPTPNADPKTNGACSPIAVGCIAVVEFQTTFTPLTPIVARIIWPSGVTLSARSEIPVEFICPNATILVATNCPRH